MRSLLPRAGLAVARAWSVPLAIVAAVGVVGVGFVIGPVFLAIPGTPSPVAVWRVVPALLASCGAVAAAGVWTAFERVGVRPPLALATARLAIGAAVVAAGAVVLAAAAPSGHGLAVVSWTCFAVLAPVAVVLPQHWGFAVPPILFALVYLPLDLLPQ